MVVFLAREAKCSLKELETSRAEVPDLVGPAAHPLGTAIGVLAFLVFIAFFAVVCVGWSHRHFLGARVLPSPAHAEVTSRVAVLHLVVPAAYALGTAEVLPLASAFAFPALAVASFALKGGTCKADSS